MTTQFIQHPGRSGMFGALMDEYARAAEDFCRVVETFDGARFDSDKPANSGTTRSPRILSAHVCGATHRYAHYIRKARGVDFLDRYDVDPSALVSARDIRPRLIEGITFTETTVEPLRDASEADVRALTFPVRWSPQQYDPEMILEHAICHLLRHRRQLERW